ncbi:hypothetical protein U1Q18_015116 [Sarracenia purpurea var. burkii]
MRYRRNRGQHRLSRVLMPSTCSCYHRHRHPASILSLQPIHLADRPPTDSPMVPIDSPQLHEPTNHFALASHSPPRSKFLDRRRQRLDDGDDVWLALISMFVMMLSVS